LITAQSYEFRWLTKTSGVQSGLQAELRFSDVIEGIDANVANLSEMHGFVADKDLVSFESFFSANEEHNDLVAWP